MDRGIGARPAATALERGILYRPLPSQMLFHQTGARFKGFSGPVGSGKSQALCHEAIRLAYVNAGRQGLIGAPTYSMLRDATQASLFEILSLNKLPFEFSKAENVLTFEDTGSRILFRSLDDPERLRGTNLAWFGVDELTYATEDAWIRLEGRIRDPKAQRLCGFAVWTPKGYDWVYRRFIKEKIDGYEVIQAKPFENRHLLEQIPDYYDRLRKSYDPKFFQQEVLGEYVATGACRAYHAFDRQVHLMQTVYDPMKPLYWSMDFNYDPMASVIAQRLRGGEIAVLDEIVLSRASTADACEEFARRYGKHQGGVKVYWDATGNAMQSSSGKSNHDAVMEYLRKAEVRNVYHSAAKVNPPVADRVREVNGCFLNADGERRMVIDPRCGELIADLEEVAMDESGRIDKLRDKRRSHVSDALGYLVVGLMNPRRPNGERGQPL